MKREDGLSVKTKDMDIFEENEIKANYIVALALLMMAVVWIPVFIMLEIGEFDAPRFEWRPAMIFLEAVLIFGFVLEKRYKGQKAWLKSVLLAILVFCCGSFNLLFTSSAALFLCLPIILSIRYFSTRLSVYVSVLTFIVYVITGILGAEYGIIDLNYVELPIGTKIVMEDTTWLIDVIERMEYDHFRFFINNVEYGIFPDLLMYLILSLVSIFVTRHGRILIIRQHELAETTARLEAELDIASKIQIGSIPSKFPAFPDRHEFNLYATVRTANEVGGDFYDFFMPDDDHLDVVIADVSGKGIPAALFMMTSKTLIRSEAASIRNPSEILMAVNAKIAEDNDEDMFVTVWLGILEISTGILTYANAGHERVAIYQNGSWKLEEKGHSGVAIGMYAPEEMDELPERYKITDHKVQLLPGDVIYQYTDGVTEATDRSEELFGEERLISVLSRSGSTDPFELILHVSEKIDDFVKDEPQFDDITMLGLKYFGAGNIIGKGKV